MYVSPFGRPRRSVCVFRVLDDVAAVTCGHAVAAATDDGVPQLRLRACFCTIVSLMTSLVTTVRVLRKIA